MNVSTTGYPPVFYRNEPINIKCTGTEYTTLVALQIWGRVNTGYQRGCSNLGGNVGPVNGLLEPAFPSLTKEFCESSLHFTTPPSTLSVTGKVTDDLIGLQLYCFASEYGVDDVKDGDLTIDTLRGELFVP